MPHSSTSTFRNLATTTGMDDVNKQQAPPPPSSAETDVKLTEELDQLNKKISELTTKNDELLVRIIIL